MIWEAHVIYKAQLFYFYHPNHLWDCKLKVTRIGVSGGDGCCMVQWAWKEYLASIVIIMRVMYQINTLGSH